jgi:hypothetical protein
VKGEIVFDGAPYKPGLVPVALVCRPGKCVCKKGKTAGIFLIQKIKFRNQLLACKFPF